MVHWTSCRSSFERIFPSKIREGSQKVCETLSSDRLCVQKAYKNSRNSHKLKFFYETVDFFVLDISFKPIFRSNQSRLLEPQNVAAKDKICSKIAEHNREA